MLGFCYQSIVHVWVFTLFSYLCLGSFSLWASARWGWSYCVCNEGWEGSIEWIMIQFIYIIIDCELILVYFISIIFFISLCTLLITMINNVVGGNISLSAHSNFVSVSFLRSMPLSHCYSLLKRFILTFYHRMLFNCVWF